jgi:hypothetical protein
MKGIELRSSSPWSAAIPFELSRSVACWIRPLRPHFKMDMEYINGYKRTGDDSVAFSLQTNYTHWSTDTCRRSLVPTSVARGVSRDQRDGSPTAVNLFSRPEPLLFFQVAPHLSSRGWVDPVPDPLLRRKLGSAGNRTRNLCVSSQELWPLDHRGSQWRWL